MAPPALLLNGHQETRPPRGTTQSTYDLGNRLCVQEPPPRSSSWLQAGREVEVIPDSRLCCLRPPSPRPRLAQASVRTRASCLRLLLLLLRRHFLLLLLRLLLRPHRHRHALPDPLLPTRAKVVSPEASSFIPTSPVVASGPQGPRACTVAGGLGQAAPFLCISP